MSVKMYTDCYNCFGLYPGKVLVVFIITLSQGIQNYLPSSASYGFVCQHIIMKYFWKNSLRHKI